MRDRSKQLLVINTGKKESEQTRLPAQSGTTHIIGGGGLSVNMADYLLKSIWDKVFEIRTDSQGTEYIFGKLPMVTQYGITMYSGDGVDVPSLASGLPFDGRTIWYNPDTQQIEVIGGTGGGSGEGVSNFWDLSGIPSWITNSKPKYTYSEIEGTPDLSKYALASQIPSLSGYATESWVAKQNYATKATTLSGYGITDAYTKTNVDDLLKSYVTLGGTQTITGEKNFTGGLKVNGSPIYYDTDKKYWKLEGDLLVTGGVTMYGNEGTYTPSTIMDAISVDGTTISKEGGILKVIGGTGGGLDITALQNYLTQNSYLNVTSGDNRYLQLSGGTLTDGLTISAGNLIVSGSDTVTNSLYPTKDKQYTLGNSSRYWSDIYTKSINGGTPWTSANDGSGSGLDADLLDGKHADSFMNFTTAKTYVGASMGNENLSKLASGDGYIEFWDSAGGWFNGKWGKLIAVSGFEGSLSGNASSATKLQTARTIWGQSFDGTGNISGHITNASSFRFSGNIGIWQGNLWSSLNTDDIAYYATRHLFWGNVGIGTTSTDYKLEVVGTLGVHTSIKLYNGDQINGKNGLVFNWSSGAAVDTSIYDGNYGIILSCKSTGNVGIGTTSPAYKLHVEGTMYGDLKMKTPRTIWGQSFDGSGNVSGNLTLENNYEIVTKNTSGSASSTLYRTKSNNLIIGEGIAKESNDTYISGNNLFLRYGTGLTNGISLISSGNVGIGITSPSYTLDVRGTCRASTSVTSNMFFTNGEYGIWKGSSFTGGLSANDLVYYAEKNVFYGNVGIGTTNPKHKLDVNGVIGANGNILLEAANGLTGGGIAFWDGSGFVNGTINAANLILNNAGGNVGIGTISPSAKLHVSGDILATGNVFINNLKTGWKANSNQIWMILNDSAKIVVTENLSEFRTNILATGGITMYSQRSLKNIQDERGLSLAELSTIKPTRYTWKDGRDNRLHFGGIADDIQQVLPEVVYSTSDGILTMDYGNAAFAVASSLIKPVVDHEKRIAMLQERIVELEEEVERLRAS